MTVTWNQLAVAEFDTATIAEWDTLIVDAVSVVPVVAAFTIPTVTATHVVEHEAAQSPVSESLGVVATTATYTALATALVDPVTSNGELSWRAFTSPEWDVLTLDQWDAFPLGINAFVIPAVTATSELALAATTASVAASFGIVDPTATSVSEFAATSDALTASWSLTATTPTWVAPVSAASGNVAASLSVVATTATYAGEYTATVSPVLTGSISWELLTKDQWDTLDLTNLDGLPVSTPSWVAPDVTAEFAEAYQATIDPITVNFALTATTASILIENTASLTPVSANWSLPDVAPEHVRPYAERVCIRNLTLSAPEATLTLSAPEATLQLDASYASLELEIC